MEGTKISYLYLKRLTRGLTQTDVAKALGVAQTVVSAYENYRVKVPQHRLERYCELLEITPEIYEDVFARRLFVDLAKVGDLYHNEPSAPASV